VFLFCAAIELCVCMGTSVMCTCIHMSTDITTTEGTFPKETEKKLENLNLSSCQKIPTLLNSEKTSCTGGKGCLHHRSDEPVSMC